MVRMWRGGYNMAGVWKDETETTWYALSNVTCATSEISKKRDPFSSDLRDLILLCGIRRANLDAFWAKRTVTVKSNLTLMLRIGKVQEEDHGIPRGHMFRPQGPHPVEDIFGMMTAVVLLDHSLNAGIKRPWYSSTLFGKHALICPITKGQLHLK
jgi:hypothetical protein